MTEEPHDEEFLDLFKPKADASAEHATQVPEPEHGSSRASEVNLGRPVPGETSSANWGSPPLRAEALPVGPSETSRTLRTVGVFVGGGCLLLMLAAVVVFAFFQVFVRRGEKEKAQDTPTPAPTAVVVFTPVPTVAVVESPLIVPVVSSTDVRVPVALPEQLTIGETIFNVQEVRASAASWPDAPATADTAAWAYGTVVNFVLGLAPTSSNADLISLLQVGDELSLRMSTGFTLIFNVSEKSIGATNEALFFEQIRPRLTLALLTSDPARRTVVIAAFSGDQSGDPDLFLSAAIGLVGTQVDQGPARLAVLETYQVDGTDAGLPVGASYLLMDVRVENTGTKVLEPMHFQTFVIDSASNRYPQTLLAEQYAHYGLPTEPLAPGETVIGSFGYLIAGSSDTQVRWAFNPLPGSDHWVIVPMSFQLPRPPATSELPMPVGVARITVASNDVFVNRDDGLLDVLLRIENVSTGVVQVTADEVSLSSWTDGELSLVAPAPLLPWVIEPGELRLFQLQFRLPTADTALLDVAGYTFSIENLGGR